LLFDNGYDVQKFKNDLSFTKDKFIERSLSASYSLKNGDKEYENYIADLQKLFDKYAVDDILVIPNETVAYIGKV
jgi:hypothetical protein